MWLSSATCLEMSSAVVGYEGRRRTAHVQCVVPVDAALTPPEYQKLSEHMYTYVDIQRGVNAINVHILCGGGICEWLCICDVCLYGVVCVCVRVVLFVCEVCYMCVYLCVVSRGVVMCLNVLQVSVCV